MIGGVPGVRPEHDHEALHASSVPNLRAAEEYVAPIMEKIARTQEMEPDEPEATPAPERDAEELARRSRGKVELKYRSTITHQHLGQLSQRDKPQRDSVLMGLKRKRIHLLMGIPEWKHRVLSARFDKNGRIPYVYDAQGNAVEDTPRIDKQILEVLEQSNALFGDWKVEYKPLIFGARGG